VMAWHRGHDKCQQTRQGESMNAKLQLHNLVGAYRGLNLHKNLDRGTSRAAPSLFVKSTAPSGSSCNMCTRHGTRSDDPM
jgi:hypothetical protein